MKYPKHILLSFFCLLSFSSFAQFSNRTFKPFKIVASMGYVRPLDIPYKYALDFQLEPKYAFTDNFWLGLRLETAVLVQRSLFGDDYQAIALFSILPSFDYSYVINEEFRPFVGIGAGTYTSQLYYDGAEKVGGDKAETNIGFCPRIGLDYKHFTITFEHNFVKGGISYSAIKAGFCIGGGTVD
jgi:opacity protein-like surface antigen